MNSINQNEKAKSELAAMGLDMTPKGAGYTVGNFFKRRNITPTEAGRTMGVSHSTISRLINGGALTEKMAKALVKNYGLSASLLFTLEAEYHAYNVTKELAIA